jgi:hypothetical protein
MRNQKNGKIVNITSMGGRIAIPFHVKPTKYIHQTIAIRGMDDVSSKVRSE